jgi:hypothetical protein
MSRAHEVEAVSAPPKAATATKLRRFAAPESLAAEFGVTTQTEDHIQGVVPTEKVRELLDAFGLHERTEVQFPFCHMKRQHGEIWRMRIEPASAHTVEGKTVLGHQWVYMQDQPERVGSAN